MGKEYVIDLSWEDETNVWTAINDDIPIALEDESFERLLNKVRAAIPELIEMNGLTGKITPK